jgi:hypothetical protein
MGKKVCSVLPYRESLPEGALGGLLSSAEVEATLEAARLEEAAQNKQPPKAVRQRIYTPLVTLGAFLWQVLRRRSCREAVAQVNAYRQEQGLPEIASDTSSYCKARARLPEKGLHDLVEKSGQRLESRAPAAWRWRGRPVKLVDGTTESMPDTAANQKAYPQPQSQKKGLGFPLARMVVLFGLATGAVLKAVLGPYQGKKTGEMALFYQLLKELDAGDIVVGDRYYDCFVMIALLLRRGVDVVFRMNSHRKADFRRGQRLGKDDHIVTWRKPTRCPDWLDVAVFAQLPETITMREVRVHVERPGFRTRVLWIVTSLLDAEAFPVEEIAEVLRRRWEAELHLRTLKRTLSMHTLTGQTPAMVRKEIAAHFLLYNLIRGEMAEAARRHRLEPRQLSFSGARAELEAAQPRLCEASPTQWKGVYQRLLARIASHQVGDRPDRVEPRACKRRPKPIALLAVPRDQARARLCRGRRSA